jgi:hypothetical protein
MTLQQYLKSFKSVWGALTGLAVVVAGILKFSALVPPWPDEAGVGASSLAVVACVVGIILGFFAKPRSESRSRIIGVTVLMDAVIVLLIYLYLLSWRVVDFHETVGNEEIVRRIVVGTELANTSEHHQAPLDLIKLYGIDGSAWTHRSLTNARICLLSTYLAFYLLLTFGFGILQTTSTSFKG